MSALLRTTPSPARYESAMSCPSLVRRCVAVVCPLTGGPSPDPGPAFPWSRRSDPTVTSRRVQWGELPGPAAGPSWLTRPVYAQTAVGSQRRGMARSRRRGVDHVSQASTAASLVRVSVSSGTRRADLGVPGGIPVVELVPELARELGVLDPGNASHGFRLVAGGGVVVDPDRSLAAQGITDGAVLSLETVDVTTDKVYDDVVEAVADVVETQFAPWTARHSAGTAIGAATVFLLCAAWALFTARDTGLLVSAVAGAVSLLLIGTAAVLEARTQATGAVALAGVPLVYAAVAGFAVKPQGPLWGEGLLYAGAAVAVAGLLGAAALPRHRLVLAAGAV